jgi:hypothetical protein
MVNGMGRLNTTLRSSRSFSRTPALFPTCSVLGSCPERQGSWEWALWGHSLHRNQPCCLDDGSCLRHPRHPWGQSVGVGGSFHGGSPERVHQGSGRTRACGTFLLCPGHTRPLFLPGSLWQMEAGAWVGRQTWVSVPPPQGVQNQPGGGMGEQSRGQSPTPEPSFHWGALLPQVTKPYLPSRGWDKVTYNWFLLLVNTFPSSQWEASVCPLVGTGLGGPEEKGHMSSVNGEGHLIQLYLGVCSSQILFQPSQLPLGGGPLIQPAPSLPCFVSVGFDAGQGQGTRIAPWVDGLPSSPQPPLCELPLSLCLTQSVK